jgi:hypothetical protein
LLLKAYSTGRLQLTNDLEVAQNDLLVALDESFITDFASTDTLKSTSEEPSQILKTCASRIKVGNIVPSI